jgi:membrane protein implicated in regulation of membrane protease activity
VGRRYKLREPIRDGRGAIIIDDTRWEIKGPDLDAGAWVEVTGADGARLMVKPAEAGFPLSGE